jgi:hypothetical protein
MFACGSYTQSGKMLVLCDMHMLRLAIWLICRDLYTNAVSGLLQLLSDVMLVFMSLRPYR